MVRTADSLLSFVRGFDVRCVRRERDLQISLPSSFISPAREEAHQRIASAFSFCLLFCFVFTLMIVFYFPHSVKIMFQ